MQAPSPQGWKLSDGVSKKASLLQQHWSPLRSIKTLKSKIKKNSGGPSPGYCFAAALLLAPPTDKEASPLRLPFLIQVKTFLWLSNPAWSSHSTLPEDQRGSGQEEQRAPPPAWETPTACAAAQPESGWKQSLFTPNRLNSHLSAHVLQGCIWDLWLLAVEGGVRY